MKAYDFIEENEEYFFHWLFRTNPKQFPRVCEFAADVLGCWLHVQYPDEKIRIYEGLYDGWSHCWVSVNGQIVDFTATQFYGGKNQEERDDLSDEDFFKMYFLSYLPSPFVRNISEYEIEDNLFVAYYDYAKKAKELGINFAAYLDVVSGKVKI